VAHANCPLASVPKIIEFKKWRQHYRGEAARSKHVLDYQDEGRALFIGKKLPVMVGNINE